MPKKRSFQDCSSSQINFKSCPVDKKEFIVPRERVVKQHLSRLAQEISKNNPNPFLIRKIYNTEENEKYFEDLFFPFKEDNQVENIENFDSNLSCIESQIDSMIQFGLETSVRAQIYQKDLFYTDGILPYTHPNRPELRTFNFAIMSNSEVKGAIVVSCNLEKKKTWIDSLIIDKVCKRQGYGRILVYAASIIAALHGHHEMYLDTSIEGKAFYQKIGFIPKPGRPKGSILKFVINNIDNLHSFGEKIAALPPSLDIRYLSNDHRNQIEQLSEIKSDLADSLSRAILDKHLIVYYNHLVKQKIGFPTDCETEANLISPPPKKKILERGDRGRT